MKEVFIVTYFSHQCNEIEGVFKTFKDAENFANQLRGEIISLGNFNDSVGVKSMKLL